jgi:hypothetical protein
MLRTDSGRHQRLFDFLQIVRRYTICFARSTITIPKSGTDAHPIPGDRWRHES